MYDIVQGVSVTLSLVNLKCLFCMLLSEFMTSTFFPKLLDTSLRF